MVTGDVTGRDVMGVAIKGCLGHGLLAPSGDGSNAGLCKKIGFNELIIEKSKSDQLSSIVEQV